jgi:hypothetical protein
MTTFLVVIGLVALVFVPVFLWSWRSKRQALQLMQATETTPAGHVAKLVPGTQAEVKGKLRCASPLTGELSQVPCAHYVATVEREYETWEYDIDRKTSRRVRKTETVKSSVLFAPFEVEDASGRVAVAPELAIVEGVTVIDRFEPHEDQAQDGSLVKKALRAITTGDQTLGFRYKEVQLPLDVDIYVLGVTAKNGMIGPPADNAKGQSFVISTKSEEARGVELGKSAKWMLGLAVACLVGGVVSLGAAYWVTPPGPRSIPPEEVHQGATW